MALTTFNAIARQHTGMARVLEESDAASSVVYDNVNSLNKFCELTGAEPPELDIESFMAIKGGVGYIVTTVRRRE